MRVCTLHWGVGVLDLGYYGIFQVDSSIDVILDGNSFSMLTAGEICFQSPCHMLRDVPGRSSLRNPEALSNDASSQSTPFTRPFSSQSILPQFFCVVYNSWTPRCPSSKIQLQVGSRKCVKIRFSSSSLL